MLEGTIVEVVHVFLTMVPGCQMHWVSGSVLSVFYLKAPPLPPAPFSRETSYLGSGLLELFLALLEASWEALGAILEPPGASRGGSG